MAGTPSSACPGQGPAQGCAEGQTPARAPAALLLDSKRSEVTESGQSNQTPPPHRVIVETSERVAGPLCTVIGPQQE